MDLTQPIRATRIGLGVESGRKLVGLMWFSEKGHRFHTSTLCTAPGFDLTEMNRLPVYEEGGKFYTERDHRKDEAEQCKLCPAQPDDESWREFAACIGTDMAFTEDRVERAKFIEDYCNTRCAVQLECLEYGASGINANNFAVWGGVYFVRHSTERNRRIDEQRDKIKAGVFG